MIHTSPESFLQSFYTRRQPFVADEEDTTTWESVGVLFLATILTRDFLPESLCSLTGFPFDFVEAVVDEMQEGGWWFDVEFAFLVQAVADGSEERINKELESLMVEFWARIEYETSLALTDLRAGYVYGGMRSVRVN